MIGRNRLAVLSAVLVTAVSGAYADTQHSTGKTILTGEKITSVSQIDTANSTSQQSLPTKIKPKDRRASQWQREDQNKALEILSQTQYDLLVVPFQVSDQAYALDATARSLMTLSLAEYISRSTNLSVADPVLVARALGSTVRTIDRLDIQKLSTALGVSHVISGETHQNLNGAWSLSIVKRSTRAEDTEEDDLPIFKKTNIPLSGNKPAYISFLKLRDSIVSKLLPSARINKTNEPEHQLPKELASLATTEKYPTIQLLQLLAVLHPERNIDRARDNLLERSLVLTEHLNQQDSDVQLLKSRALLLLGRRQAALNILEGIVSDEGQALKEYANSNYTPIKQQPVSDSLSSLMITILQQRLGTSYDAKPDLAQLGQITDRFKPLAELISFAYQDNYLWRDKSNKSLKLALDKTYPNTQHSIEAINARQMITPTNDIEYELTSSVLKHLNTSDGYSFKSNSAGIGVQAQDYNDLIRSMAVNNAIQHIYHATLIQGKSEIGYGLVNSFQRLFQDQPEFTLMSARAILMYSGDHHGTEQESLRGAALNLARDGVAWSGRFELRNKWLRSIEDDMLSELGPVDNIIIEKYMFVTDRPAKTIHHAPAHLSKLEIGCAHNNVYSFSCFKDAYTYTGERYTGEANTTASLISDLQSRFKGHPERLDILSKYHLSKRDLSGATKVYEDAINSESQNWPPYANLGYSLIAKSRYTDALKIAMRYPGFSQIGVTDSVSLAFHAHEFGSHLYWAGAYQEAIPLYQISADLNTGSDASMSSAIRLALMKEDYEKAAEGTLYRARRYQSAYAIRDLAGLVIILGDADWAWNMIDSQQDSLRNPEVWIGALMAQRALGHDSQRILNWGLSRAQGENDHETMTLALRQLFLSATLDRDIPNSLSDELAKNDKRPSLIMPSVDDTIAIRDTLKPDFHFGPPRVSIKTGSIIKSRMQYGAEALRALSKKDYANAFDLLDEASHLYPLNEFLPYYALAAAKTEKTNRINAYIGNHRRLSPNESIHNLRTSILEFDVSLAEAYLHSAKGNHKEALASLVNSNHQVKHTGSRVFPTRYQLLETARLIYLDTSEDAYRQFAVELAKSFSVIEPYQAYTHSLVAMLSNDRDERVDALSKVIVLDPNSRSLALSEATELSEAKKRAASGYPRTPEKKAGI